MVRPDHKDKVKSDCSGKGKKGKRARGSRNNRAKTPSLRGDESRIYLVRLFEN